jgi:hypothetical protein
MGEEYGRLIDNAVRAVAQMHGDTSKLLVDCDKRIGRGRSSVLAAMLPRTLHIATKQNTGWRKRFFGITTPG